MGVACRKVFVDCEKIHRLPYGEEVYPGFAKYGVRFTYVYPSPKCVLVPTTIINFSEAVEIELGEAGSNIILTAVKKKKTKENKKIVRRKYVYPKKIYMEFRKLYVDPILRGEPPFSSGVVFAGAPGVGKSTLATLTAKMLGLPVYTIDPTIASKWVGESLAYDEEVILFTKDGDVVRKPIGELEKDFNRYGELYTYSFTRDGKCQIKRVSRVIKHLRTRRMLLIKTATGREIKVTGDHSLFTMDRFSGKMKEIEADKLKPGDLIAIPAKLPEPPYTTNKIDLVKLVMNEAPDGFTVVFKESVDEILKRLNQKDIDELKKRLGSNGFHNSFVYRIKVTSGIRVSTYAKIKDILDKRGIKPIGIRRKANKHILPAVLEIDEDLAWFLGLYLADGVYRKRTHMLAISLSSDEKELIEKAVKIAKRFGEVSVGREKGRRCVSIRTYNGTFAMILRLLGIYGYDGERRLHPIFFKLPNRVLSAFLRGYFDGDGTFTSKYIESSTVSKKLANDIALLLLRFGIITRIREKKTKKEHCWRIKIIGQSNLVKFMENIGFSHRAKRERLKQYLEKVKNSNMLRGMYIAIPEKISEKIATVWRGYKPRRIGIETLRRLVKQEFINGSEIENILNMEIYWDEVVSVKEIEYNHPYVYDLSVDDNENFISGFGGVIAHNSENRLRDLIDDAVSNAPSMVIIDDAEWLLRPRSLAGSEEMHEVYLNMQNILFQKLQEITDEEIPTLFIATTNIKLSELDEAFKRYGRFGETILFPLPDYEAIYTVVRDMVGDERTAVRIARMSVNSGLSMADAIGLAKKIQYGLEPVVKEKAGRGYKRIYVERVEGFEKIFKYFPREALSKRSRILMPMKEDIGTAIATQIFYSADKTVIKIVDPRHIMEAVHMANLTGSGIMVSSLLDPTVLDYIHKNAEVPVVYLGEAYPKHLPVYTFYNLDTLRRIVGWKPIVESVMYMYDVSIPNDLWGKIERTANSSEGLERILETMISLGVLNEKILNYIRTK